MAVNGRRMAAAKKSRAAFAARDFLRFSKEIRELQEFRLSVEVASAPSSFLYQ
ncbi:MAG: hypothetical protein LBP86_11480 [Azoarcus sp.]|nr:hypothetical protein [Azoarcus sp.]